MHRYPGVLIGRLGINKEYKHQGIGSDLMTFIKSWFIDAGNKTGCRFLIVDAYNENIPLNYYLKTVSNTFSLRKRKKWNIQALKPERI